MVPAHEDHVAALDIAQLDRADTLIDCDPRATKPRFSRAERLERAAARNPANLDHAIAIAPLRDGHLQDTFLRRPRECDRRDRTAAASIRPRKLEPTRPGEHDAIFVAIGARLKVSLL